MSEGGLSLKVLEAYTRDVGRGVARIDYDSMDTCLLYTSPSPRDQRGSRMPSSA